MATTYTLIASNTLTGTAANVTFSSIPSTYTDLVLRASARGDNSGTTFANFIVTINGSSSNVYSYTRMVGNGSTVSNGQFANQVNVFANYYNASSSTANTFGNAEFYFPNYTASANKPFSYYGLQEDNSSTAIMTITSALFRDTTAISSITLTASGSANFVTNSSFYLYGIKNS